MADFKKYIEINPEIRFEKSTIRGARITVGDVLGWLAAGMNVDEIISDFPQLKKEQIFACLGYAEAQTKNT